MTLYTEFVKLKMQAPEIQKLKPKDKMIEIGKLWREAKLNKATQDEGSGLFEDIKEGITSRLKAFQGIRMDYRKKDREFIKKYGDFKIIEMSINRQPVQKYVKTLLNILSLGKAQDILDKYYDEIYHIFIHIILESPYSKEGQLKQRKDIILEKNQTIQIEDFKDEDKTNVQTFPIKNIPEGLTLRMFLDTGLASTDKKTFFEYDPLSKNCGQFISLLLKANGMLETNPGAHEFIFQDLKKLREGLPSLTKKIMKKITDVAAISDVAISGYGLRV